MANRRKHPIPEIGQTFGDWTVVDNTLQQCPTLASKVKGVTVQCKCGNSKILPPGYLHTGKSLRCNECKGQAISQTRFKGVGNLSSSYFSQLKKGAEQRNLTFDITMEYLWSLFQAQRGRCALSNIEITLSKSYANKINKGRRTNQPIYETASVDRIDSSRGYVEGNVQWVHKTINKMKNNLNQDEFVEFCKSVVEQNRTPRIQTLTRTSVEGIHRWRKCPIKEVEYLKEYHRHTFNIVAANYVSHSDRDIEFIQHSHQIKEHLHDKYFNTHYGCLFFDDMSCEMIAEELVDKFKLAWCEVNEDGEGGAIVHHI